MERGISIHAPLAGRDRILQKNLPATRHFNPRAPRGARPKPLGASAFVSIFQSTRPSRGATWTMSCELPGEVLFQSTRPSRGATWLWTITAGRWLRFQSTRPSRGATITATGVLGLSNNFNPRAPRGARRIWLPLTVILPEFQSTRPSRGATQYFKTETQPEPISIHAPLAGRDVWYRSNTKQEVISIHAPLAGRDCKHSKKVIDLPYFNPRAPRGARRPLDGGYGTYSRISIHAPLAGRDPDTRGLGR